MIKKILLMATLTLSATAYGQTADNLDATHDKQRKSADQPEAQRHDHDEDWPHEHRGRAISIITFGPIVTPVEYAPDQVLGPCGYVSCAQAKYNSDTADLSTARAHAQSLQDDMARLEHDIDRLNESSGYDQEIADNEAKIDRDRTDIATTQDGIARLQSVVSTDQAALR